jgi:hypothetical protein
MGRTDATQCAKSIDDLQNVHIASQLYRVHIAQA